MKASQISQFSKAVLILLLAVGLGSQVFAQVYPTRTVTTMAPPYPTNLDAFVGEAAARLNMQLFVNDATISNYPVKLRLVLRSNSTTIYTNPAYAQQPTYIDGGENYTFTGDELAHLFRIENLIFEGYTKQQYRRTGQLPEGVYQMSFEVYDYYRDFNISSPMPAMMWISLNSPPMLNMPRKESEMTIHGPQNILFNWTAMHSPFSHPNFRPEYTFELWEIYPENMDPYQAVRSTRPVFSTIIEQTSYHYSVNEPQLIPGRRYAWRIRVSDPEGIARFKENGYSEVWSFKYGMLCETPEPELNGVGTKHASIKWSPVQNMDNYTIHYRPKNSSTGDWYTSNTTFLEGKISNLRSNTEYVVELSGKCSTQESGRSSRLEFTTDQNLEFECGNFEQLANIENKEPLPALLPGDRFMAGDFEVEVAQVDGSGGTFSGKGFILVPFFNFIKIEADLSGVQINTDYQMYGGSVSSIYNLSNSLTISTGAVGDFISGSHNDGKLKDLDNPFTDSATVVVNSEGVESVVVSGNTVVITHEDGSTQEIEVGDKDVVAVTAPDGSSIVVDAGSGTVYTDGSKGGQAPSGGSSGVKGKPDEGPSEFKVSFAPHQSHPYGYDVPGTLNPPNNYRNNRAWISAQTGMLGKLEAQVEGSPSDSVFFSAESGNMVMIAPGESDNKKQLMFSGIGHKDEDEIVAWYSKYTEKEDKTLSQENILAGAINLVSYDRKLVELCLVPVNGSACPSAAYVQGELNKIYSSAVVQWSVTNHPNITVELGDGRTTVLDNIDKDKRMDYTAEMKDVIRELKRSDKHDRQVVYLFFLENGTYKAMEGYMPLKQRFGFVFKEWQNPNELIRTIAHELGHGCFRLRHTFSDENKYKLPQNQTSNLMDYAPEEGSRATLDKTDLYKYQWDYVHDPESMLFSSFEDEEEAMSMREAKSRCLMEEDIKNFKSLVFYDFDGKPINLEGCVPVAFVAQEESDERIRGAVALFKLNGELYGPFSFKGKDGKRVFAGYARKGIDLAFIKSIDEFNKYKFNPPVSNEAAQYVKVHLKSNEFVVQQKDGTEYSFELEYCSCEEAISGEESCENLLEKTRKDNAAPGYTWVHHSLYGPIIETDPCLLKTLIDVPDVPSSFVQEGSYYYIKDDVLSTRTFERKEAEYAKIVDKFKLRLVEMIASGQFISNLDKKDQKQYDELDDKLATFKKETGKQIYAITGRVPFFMDPQELKLFIQDVTEGCESFDEQKMLLILDPHFNYYRWSKDNNKLTSEIYVYHNPISYGSQELKIAVEKAGRFTNFEKHVLDIYSAQHKPRHVYVYFLRFDNTILHHAIHEASVSGYPYINKLNLYYDKEGVSGIRKAYEKIHEFGMANNSAYNPSSIDQIPSIVDQYEQIDALLKQYESKPPTYVSVEYNCRLREIATEENHQDYARFILDQYYHGKNPDNYASRFLAPPGMSNEAIFQDPLRYFVYDALDASGMILSPIGLDVATDAAGLLIAAYSGDIDRAAAYGTGVVMVGVSAGALIKIYEGSVYIIKKNKAFVAGTKELDDFLTASLKLDPGTANKLGTRSDLIYIWKNDNLANKVSKLEPDLRKAWSEDILENSELAVLFDLNPGLVDSWRALDNAGVDAALRKAPSWLNRVSGWTDEGLEVASKGRILKDGNEVGRIVGDRLNVKYTGYGNDIVCDATKTTTGIGKYDPPGGVGTKQVIDSKLSKSGENPGGINILNDTRNTQGWSDQKIWDEINQPWLDDAIARGDNIRAVSNPLDINNVFTKTDGIPASAFTSSENLANYLKNLNNPDLIENLSFYGREIRHLSQNNYLFDATSKAFMK